MLSGLKSKLKKAFMVAAIGLTIVANSFSPAQAANEKSLYEHFQRSPCFSAEIMREYQEQLDFKKVLSFKANGTEPMDVLIEEDKAYLLTADQKIACLMDYGQGQHAILPGLLTAKEQIEYLPKKLQTQDPMIDLIKQMQTEGKELFFVSEIDQISKHEKDFIPHDDGQTYMLVFGSIEGSFDTTIWFYSVNHEEARISDRYKGTELYIEPEFQSETMKLVYAAAEEQKEKDQAEIEPIKETPDADEERKASQK